MIRNYTLNIDMDGVLADFDRAVLERLGAEKGSMPKGKMWGAIKRYNDEVAPWFYTLPMMPDAMELWEFANKHFENVQILTASGSTPADAPTQKMNWIVDHLGEDVKVNVVGAGREKAAFASQFSILVDDRQKVVTPFVEAGGVGVLHRDTEQTIEILRILMDDWS